MERLILHADLNNCYASIECLHRPELRGKPVAVGGDPEQRHGIILAKNELAKKYQVKTGEALWQARQKCPELVIVPPNYPLYLRYSNMARKIYLDYTDQVEPFGIDEAWLDVTGSQAIYGTGGEIAEQIRQRIKLEMGVTVSIGVSFNKIFAKLGSDMKKPDAITVISRENYQEKVFPLPVEDLLYVGRSTARKLKDRGYHTIGQLAGCNPQYLPRSLGKWAYVLHAFANGQDTSPVQRFDSLAVVKSIGNSTTTPRDLLNENDVSMTFFVLAESVASRMREHGFKGRTICISVRNTELFSFTRQAKIEQATNLAVEIARESMKLFRANYRWTTPIRSVGVSVTDFVHDDIPVQFDLYQNEKRRDRQLRLESTVDDLRRRFGSYSVRRAALLQDPELTGYDPKIDHTIHPQSYKVDSAALYKK